MISSSWPPWSKRVDIWNRQFKHYPRIVYDHGWVYGVWYCGTAWVKASLHGEYPSTFLQRAKGLFPGARDILHCPSGTLKAKTGETTVDMVSDTKRRPRVVADAADLPFQDNSFDLYLSDPPYSSDDSAVYGTNPYRLRPAMREAWRVLRPNGYFGLLHLFFPPYRSPGGHSVWRHEGLIAVITGFQRKTRVFSIFRCVKGNIDGSQIDRSGTETSGRPDMESP